MFGMADALMDKNLLILDLDETLLYGTERPLDREPDLLASGYFVYFRPGLENFIRHVASLYRLAVWTSASRGYALEICSRIFADVQLEFMWASERCTIQWDHETGSVCGAKRCQGAQEGISAGAGHRGRRLARETHQELRQPGACAAVRRRSERSRTGAALALSGDIGDLYERAKNRKAGLAPISGAAERSIALSHPRN